VANQDTKMHTYLEIIHTMKFEVSIINCLSHCTRVLFVFKFEVFGEGPYLNQMYIEFGAHHHKVSTFGDELCDTQMHIMPPESIPMGGLIVWFKV
jgi:hypothetical protein